MLRRAQGSHKVTYVILNTSGDTTARRDYLTYPGPPDPPLCLAVPIPGRDRRTGGATPLCGCGDPPGARCPADRWFCAPCWADGPLFHLLTRSSTVHGASPDLVR